MGLWQSSSGGETSNPKVKCTEPLETSPMFKKSDRSIEKNPGFSSGGGGPRFVSLMSDQSMEIHHGFSSGGEPNCVSMKSERSMGRRPAFRCRGGGPRCLSMMNDRSMGKGPGFTVEGEPRCVSLMNDRSMWEHSGFSSGGGEPSCVSMKSDQSRREGPGFSGGGEPRCVFLMNDQSMGKHPGFSSGGGEPSCVSMKSDQSRGEGPGFSGGGEPRCVFLMNDQSMGKHPGFSSGGGEPSCVSMKSDQSRGEGPGFSGGATPSDPEQLCTEAALHTHTLVRGTGHLLPDSHQPVANVLQRVIKRHKTSMKYKYENLFEGFKTDENKKLLNSIFTQLYIIEGESKGVNKEHEVLQMEKTTRRLGQDTPINYLDIFKHQKVHKDPKHIERKEDSGPKVPYLRSVLTKGIAGIGKTVSVQKFILDWAEGKANQDVDFLFVFPFRELNLIKNNQYSLHGLLCDFHPEIKDLDPKIYDQHKAVFIFDGLDESRIPLNFSQCEKVSDITMTSTVGVLMTNLIKGELLPSALIWITCRPAAANKIPSKHINRVTEIQGFNDPQKEEYFRKRISDQDQAQKIISHIKTVRSLHIMCHIPVFCWISATVLQRIINQHHTEIPKTLTEMYSHFLITQINMKNEKYEGKNERDPKKLLKSNRTELLKLAELAFKQLMKGNVMFYEEDLRESSIDITKASVYSGVFTEIFREECVLYQKKVYCFVHLSFQEFLAAVYVFHYYKKKNIEELRFVNPWYRIHVSLDDLLNRAVDKTVESQNGQLDLFLRFLLGISLESNQRLLQGLLTHTHRQSEKTTEYIKSLIKADHRSRSTERSINLFLCLSEMKNQSLSREIQENLRSEKHSEVKLSPGQCSAFACMLLTSEEVLEELDLKKYNTSEEGYRRLIPAVTVCRRAVLADCVLSKDLCRAICSALQSLNFLKELDLSNNDLQDSGVELLSAGLKDSHCKLEKLRLSGCMVTEKGCSSLALALKSNPSHLRELDLTYNHPGESGVKLLSDVHCNLEKLVVENGGQNRMKPGLHKYACKLTLDLNTAHPCLSLSEENRKVQSVRGNQPYPDHTDRFDWWKQVLSAESLTGRCYWEVEFTGEGADIAVSYRGIGRKGRSEDGRFGFNNLSWSLKYCKNKYTVYHNSKRICEVPHLHQSGRVGVYLDWLAGTLSFYSISPDTHTLNHIHTLNTTFIKPLYAGIGVGYYSSVCVCV